MLIPTNEPPINPPDLGYYTDDELEAIEALEAEEAEANRLWLEPLEENDPAWGEVPGWKGTW